MQRSGVETHPQRKDRACMVLRSTSQHPSQFSAPRLSATCCARFGVGLGHGALVCVVDSIMLRFYRPVLLLCVTVIGSGQTMALPGGAFF